MDSLSLVSRIVSSLPTSLRMKILFPTLEFGSALSFVYIKHASPRTDAVNDSSEMNPFTLLFKPWECIFPEHSWLLGWNKKYQWEGIKTRSWQRRCSSSFRGASYFWGIESLLCHVLANMALLSFVKRSNASEKNRNQWSPLLSFQRGCCRRQPEYRWEKECHNKKKFHWRCSKTEEWEKERSCRCTRAG